MDAECHKCGITAQLRAWHARTGRGPGDHPLLQPDPPYYGFIDATPEQAAEIIEGYYPQIRATREKDIHAA
jgi:hypothetical protein